METVMARTTRIGATNMHAEMMHATSLLQQPAAVIPTTLGEENTVPRAPVTTTGLTQGAAAVPMTLTPPVNPTLIAVESDLLKEAFPDSRG